MILCVTLNPLVDVAMTVDAFYPTYRTEARRITYTAGGKGNNVARALAALGEPARALFPAGGLPGADLVALLREEGIDTIPVPVSDQTRIAVTLIDSTGEQRATFAPAPSLTAADVAAIRAGFDAALGEARAVCLSGSSPGRAADPLLAEMVAAARARGLPVLLDSYGPPLPAALAAGPTIVKLNRAETATLLGAGHDTVVAQVAALDALRRPGVRWAVMTLGAAGALFSDGEQVLRAAPPSVAAVNPIGSGDAMAAGLIAAWLRGESPRDALRLGMAAAVANVLTPEAGRITREAVQALLGEIAIAAVG